MDAYHSGIRLKKYKNMTYKIKSASDIKLKFNPNTGRLKLQKSDEVIKNRKVKIDKGFAVCLIGVDGAGKSTMADEIFFWLDNLFECSRMSMGIGRQTAGRRKIVTLKDRTTKHTILKRKIGLLRFAYRINRDIRKMEKGKENGKIYILDRYPQTSYRGLSDGPKIDEPFLLSKMEMFLLKISEKMQPELIIKIDIPLAIAKERRPDDSSEILKKKIDIIHNIKYKNSKVIKVDGSNDFDSELLQIKSIIWENLLIKKEIVAVCERHI